MEILFLQSCMWIIWQMHSPPTQPQSVSTPLLMTKKTSTSFTKLSFIFPNLTYLDRLRSTILKNAFWNHKMFLFSHWRVNRASETTWNIGFTNKSDKNTTIWLVARPGKPCVALLYFWEGNGTLSIYCVEHKRDKYTSKGYASVQFQHLRLDLQKRLFSALAEYSCLQINCF